MWKLDKIILPIFSLVHLLKIFLETAHQMGWIWLLLRKSTLLLVCPPQA